MVVKMHHENYVYDAWFNSEISADGWIPPVMSAVYTYRTWKELGTIIPSMPYMTPDGDEKPHGDIFLAGTPDGTQRQLERYFWIEADSTFTFELTDFTNMANGIVYGFARRWTTTKIYPDAIVTSNVTINASGETILFQPTISGYYSFGIKILAGGATYDSTSKFTLTGSLESADSYVYCHLPVAGFESNFARISAARMSGTSVMFSNETQELYKAGGVCGNQFGCNTDWMDVITYDGCFNTQNAFRAPAKNGIYGFIKPNSPDDFKLAIYFEVKDNILADSFYPLQGNGSFITIAGNIPQSVDGAFTRAGVLTTASAIEYVTKDVWISIATSSIQPQIFDDALEVLKIVPQFTENPLHLGMIAKAIDMGLNNAARFVVRYGPTAIKIANVVKKNTGNF